MKFDPKIVGDISVFEQNRKPFSCLSFLMSIASFF